MTVFDMDSFLGIIIESWNDGRNNQTVLSFIQIIILKTFSIECIMIQAVPACTLESYLLSGLQ